MRCIIGIQTLKQVRAIQAADTKRVPGAGIAGPSYSNPSDPASRLKLAEMARLFPSAV